MNPVPPVAQPRPDFALPSLAITAQRPAAPNPSPNHPPSLADAGGPLRCVALILPNSRLKRRLFGQFASADAWGIFQRFQDGPAYFHAPDGDATAAVLPDEIDSLHLLPALDDAWIAAMQKGGFE